jgi:DNA gyrase subunit A
VKRQKEVKDLSMTRLREGDTVLAAMAGSTRATVVLFSNFGSAYTARFVDVPASTGYGEPVQKLFKFKDGERVIAAFSLDPRVRGDIGHVPEGEEENGGRNGKNASAPVAADEDAAEAPPVHAIAVTSDGYSLRFSLAGFVEPSTRAGRRYARLPEGQEVVAVARVTGAETIIAATRDARAILCSVDEVNFLSGPGRGVILIKVQDDDRVIGAIASTGDRDLMTVETSRGSEQTISTAKYEVTGRGGKGRELLQRGQFVRVLPPEVTVPVLEGEA